MALGLVARLAPREPALLRRALLRGGAVVVALRQGLFGEANLLAVALPEKDGGSELGLQALLLLCEEAGRTTPSQSLASHLDSIELYVPPLSAELLKAAWATKPRTRDSRARHAEHARTLTFAALSAQAGLA